LTPRRAPGPFDKTNVILLYYGGWSMRHWLIAMVFFMGFFGVWLGLCNCLGKWHYHSSCRKCSIRMPAPASSAGREEDGHPEQLQLINDYKVVDSGRYQSRIVSNSKFFQCGIDSGMTSWFNSF